MSLFDESKHARFHGKFASMGLSADKLHKQFAVKIHGLGSARPTYRVTGPGGKELGHVQRLADNRFDAVHAEGGKHPDGPFPTRAMAGAAVADMHGLLEVKGAKPSEPKKPLSSIEKRAISDKAGPRIEVLRQGSSGALGKAHTPTGNKAADDRKETQLRSDLAVAKAKREVAVRNGARNVGEHHANVSAWQGKLDAFRKAREAKSNDGAPSHAGAAGRVGMQQAGAAKAEGIKADARGAVGAAMKNRAEREADLTPAQKERLKQIMRDAPEMIDRITALEMLRKKIAAGDKKSEGKITFHEKEVSGRIDGSSKVLRKIEVHKDGAKVGEIRHVQHYNTLKEGRLNAGYTKDFHEWQLHEGSGESPKRVNGPNGQTFKITDAKAAAEKHFADKAPDFSSKGEAMRRGAAGENGGVSWDKAPGGKRYEHSEGGHEFRIVKQNTAAGGPRWKAMHKNPRGEERVISKGDDFKKVQGEAEARIKSLRSGDKLAAALKGDAKTQEHARAIQKADAERARIQARVKAGKRDPAAPDTVIPKGEAAAPASAKKAADGKLSPEHMAALKLADQGKVGFADDKHLQELIKSGHIEVADRRHGTVNVTPKGKAALESGGEKSGPKDSGVRPKLVKEEGMFSHLNHNHWGNVDNDKPGYSIEGASRLSDDQLKALAEHHDEIMKALPKLHQERTGLMGALFAPDKPGAPHVRIHATDNGDGTFTLKNFDHAAVGPEPTVTVGKKRS